MNGGGGGGVERSLILFDEADLTWDDDAGFFGALRKLALDSKCPIVLTCNDLPAGLIDAQCPYQSLTFERPTAKELCLLGRRVCGQYGLGGAIGEASLLQACEMVGRDTRRLVNLLQVWMAPPA